MTMMIWRRAAFLSLPTGAGEERFGLHEKRRDALARLLANCAMVSYFALL